MLSRRAVLTPHQLRAAVAWLSRGDLAAKSGRGAETVEYFEFHGSDPKLGTVQKWWRALELTGVKFIDADDQEGPGARLRGIKTQ
jgi:hypothetical protein